MFFLKAMITDVTPPSEDKPKTEPAPVPTKTPPAKPTTRKKPLNIEQRLRQGELIDCCLKALAYCLRRFPQHFKSQYRLAYIFFKSELNRVSLQCNYCTGQGKSQHTWFDELSESPATILMTPSNPYSGYIVVKRSSCGVLLHIPQRASTACACQWNIQWEKQN